LNRFVAKLAKSSLPCFTVVRGSAKIEWGLEQQKALKNLKVYLKQMRTLEKYLALIRRMENYFKGFAVEYIERNKITKGDELMKAAARNTPLAANVFFKVIKDSTVKIVEPEPRLIKAIEGEVWRATRMAYLLHYDESDNTTEHIRMYQGVKTYQIINNELYRTSISGPFLRCISKVEGQELLLEIHARVCRGHIGARALATKVLRQRFYWPDVISDGAKLVATCEACQKISH
jgi:hypothetical protein